MENQSGATRVSLTSTRLDCSQGAGYRHGRDRSQPEVAINKVVWRQANFIQVGFDGNPSAVQCAAVAMSLIQSDCINRHGPYAYLKDVLTRLPAYRKNRIEELLPLH